MPGKYQLVISIIGFDTYSQAITISNSNVSLPDIGVFSKAITLNEVKVSPNDNPDWQKNFELFRKQFLGTSALAKECKILNPELLDLQVDEKTGILSAKSVDFLVIENNGLGYKIKYLLSDFLLDETNKRFFYSGSVLFKKLQGTASQEDEWEARRMETYKGSRMDFLRSAANGSLTQNGFKVMRFLKNPLRPPEDLISAEIKFYSVAKGKKEYRDSLDYWLKKSKLPKLMAKPDPTLLNSSDFIESKNKDGLYKFSCGDDALYIRYNKNSNDAPFTLGDLAAPGNTYNTLITFNNPLVYFDDNGTIVNPGSLSFEGAWANERLADLLPIDYKPRQQEQIPIDSTLLKKLTSNLNTLNLKQPVEKAYLNFDKPVYAAGDTIYFKAYVTLGSSHIPTTLSGVLNVELVNPADKIIESIKLKIRNGTATGDFSLADTLKQGYYRLRAYTNWMRKRR